MRKSAETAGRNTVWATRGSTHTDQKRCRTAPYRTGTGFAKGLSEQRRRDRHIY